MDRKSVHNPRIFGYYLLPIQFHVTPYEVMSVKRGNLPKTGDNAAASMFCRNCWGDRQ